MNYTEKYHLPQWVKTDRIMMDDFNQMCQDIEAGIDKAAELPWVVGSYTGNGATIREINVGFQPRFVLICTTQRTAEYSYAGLGVSMAGPNVHSNRIYLTETGFRLDISEPTQRNPDVNKSGEPYDYIAFR